MQYGEEQEQDDYDQEVANEVYDEGQDDQQYYDEQQEEIAEDNAPDYGQESPDKEDEY
jgi:hypothetical protein